ncbi:BnaC01g37310D [Brassica napus]|uniref:BnaC01g37310D protein n=1 Tax=Brassica napus TaxID=3708 RepID=A0A078H8S8_BRANA|nr:BnaC01g37310D [Brassica napus]
MVSESRTGGNRATGPDDDEEERKVIESIKEIVGNHSDADIYTALKESDMNADEAVQKLIHQDPFHEVKRRKDRKKEDAVLVEPANVKKPLESATSEVKVRTQPEHNVRRGGYSRNIFPRNAAPQNAFPRKPLESATSEVKVRTQSEHNVRRGGYSRNVFSRNAAPRNAFARNPATGSKREFRVVRDNRSNPNADEELKHSTAQSPASNISKVATTENKKGSTGGLGNHHSSGAQGFTEDCKAAADVRPRDSEIAPLHHPTRKEVSDGKETSRGATLPSTNSVSSSTDPVHVPSPVSRSSPVGAIKREVRGGGFGGKPSEVIGKDPSAGALSKIGTPNAYRSSSPNSKINQVSQTTPRESVLPSGVEKNRPLLNRQRGNRGSQYARTQQVGGHTKGVSQNKEWKRKSIQKPVGHNPGVIGTPTKSQACRPADNITKLESEAVKLQDKLSHVHISETQNVIIADHIRLPETDRCQLTFGSFVREFSSSMNSEPAAFQESCSSEELRDSDRSSPVTAPETLADGPGVKPIDILDDHLRVSESDSRVSVPSEQLLPEEEAHRSDNLDEYSEMLKNSDTLVPFQQAYGNHGSYDFPYFSQTMDENSRGQGLPSQQEQASSTHMVNNAPPSTIPMLQQQQQQQQGSMQQMYPQVHVSHFPSLMPYRQFVSPVYVPQMPMPGYSGNPAAYAHPSSGNSYVLMPGGGSHPGSNGVKYGIQQFKPVPGGPTGFGTYNSPNGYQINPPNVVGNAMGLEDPSRMKYKDGNIYVPNPQAETSEIWMQNPRDLSNLQSPPYYNVAGQTPHGAYLPSHTAHPSFNAPAATTQSSQMQFQGLFHPPQPGTRANLHHMGPGLGGNVGVGVVPSPPSQLGHPSWAANF